LGTRSADVAVIGGGPAGLNAAFRAAQLEAKVVLVEANRVGGNCLNRGCVPTNALWRLATTISAASRLKAMGLLEGSGLHLNFRQAKTAIRSLVDQIVEGTELRLEQAGVDVVKGAGRIAGRGVVEASTPSGKEEIASRNIIVATGARPAKKPAIAGGGELVLPSRSVLEMEDLPASVVVIGGNYIGAELACAFNGFGVQVTLIEASQTILPGEDEEIAGLLRETMEIQGVTVHTGARIKEVTNTEGQKRITALVGDQVRQVSAQKIIDSTAEVPNTENLGLENVGVATGDSGILVDDRMRTNVQNIFAAGDVAGRFMLSHVAVMEGLVAAENAMGGTAVARYETIPKCVYTIPEVAFVGLTEKQASERGRKAKTLRLPLSTNAAARVRWEGEGLVKMVVDEVSGGILGVQMMGPRATDLIAECALAMVFEASPEILSQVIHAHPTLAEALRDVASLVQQA